MIYLVYLEKAWFVKQVILFCQRQNGTFYRFAKTPFARAIYCKMTKNILGDEHSEELL